MLKIGTLKLENWLIMAPMAGITNLPFRLIAKSFGAGLVTTEMVSAAGLTLGNEKTLKYLKTHEDEKPLAVQIFGSSPEVMSDAAVIAVEHGANIVDINMGCPVKKVIKTGAGGAFLKSSERAKKVVSAVRKACPVPLTVKIRAGWSPSDRNACDFAVLMEDCGIDAITIHPRFVTQGYSGEADWSIISRAKEKLRIPCIGNGDVTTAARALELKAQTGCDGVMIGRGAVGNPWIFKNILELERGVPPADPGLEERRALIMKHFSLLSAYVGEKRAARMMRGLLLAYTKGLPSSSRFRGVITEIRDFQTLLATLDQYFLFLKERDS